MFTAELAPSKDTYLDSAAPSANHGAASQLEVEWTGTFGGSEKRRALMTFDLSGIPPVAVIASAVLQLDFTAIQSFTVAITPLTNTWEELYSTWVHRDSRAGGGGPSPWAVPGGDYEPLDSPHPYALSLSHPDPGNPIVGTVESTDLADLVQEALESGTLDVLLRCVSESGAFAGGGAFSSREASEQVRPRLTIQYVAGKYVLYAGATRETIDFETPVGEAPAGSQVISEGAGTDHVGDDTLVYCVVGAGPGGVESAPHETAYCEITFEDGVRTSPPPAGPVSLSVAPCRDGKALFTVVVDQSLGQVPVALLRCYNDGGAGGAVDYETQIGVDVPVSASGQYPVRFVIDPQLAHGTRVGWSVRAVSAEDVQETNTTVKYASVDSEGPPALGDIQVEVQDA